MVNHFSVLLKQSLALGTQILLKCMHMTTPIVHIYREYLVPLSHVHQNWVEPGLVGPREWGIAVLAQNISHNLRLYFKI